LQARLTLPDGSAYAETGKMLTMGFAIDEETGGGIVVLEFPNPLGLLRPGMHVTMVGFAPE
jgi:hypothetical protein